MTRIQQILTSCAAAAALTGLAATPALASDGHVTGVEPQDAHITDARAGDGHVTGVEAQDHYVSGGQPQDGHVTGQG